MPLEREMKTYEEKLPELLAHEGEFVVIHDSEIAGVFETFVKAMEAGYRKYGLSPFLVKQISAVEEIHFIGTTACRS